MHMLSRIADSLFWLNRYTERSDSLLRLMHIHYILSLDKSQNTGYRWRTVLYAHSTSDKKTILGIEHNPAEVLKNLLIDERNENSIKAIVNKARENARGAQDHLTKEVWEVVNGLYHQVNQNSLSSQLHTEHAIKLIDGFARQTALFSGITDNTMSRGLGWNFLNLGKFVERCQQSIVATRNELKRLGEEEADNNDIWQWRYLLLALSGYEMHLKTYRSGEHRANVLNQVMLNEDFTRSLIYSLIRIKYYLENIMLIHKEHKADLKHAIGRLYSKVHYMDLHSMDNDALQRFLREVQSELAVFTNQLGQAYFSYS